MPLSFYCLPNCLYVFGMYACELFIPLFIIVMARYASLYFCMCIDADDNELEVLEIIHHFVEILDRYFGSVSALL